jgi:hypothetical protein
LSQKPLTNRKSRANKGALAGAYSAPPPPDVFGKSTAPAPSHQTQAGALLLHDLFTKQVTSMLKRADLDEEQQQEILIAMSCACCGAGGMSVTAKLKKRR